MNFVYRYLYCLIILLLLFTSCSLDNSDYQDIHLKILSQFNNEPIPNVDVLVLVQNVRGSGMFSSTYEISRKIIKTGKNGEINTAMRYENLNDFFTIYIIEEEICTDVLRHTNSFFFEEVLNGNPLKLYARKYFPMQIKVKNINPYNENDKISISFYHVGSNYYSAPIYDIINNGNINEFYEGAGISGYRPLWIGENVDSTIFKRVQEGTKVKISWEVMRNNAVTKFESEFIPTVQDGTTHYEINY